MENAAPTGRPKDQSRDGDLRRAALELVAEIGYDRLTIDAVAARVRAGKATVYRRWPSKAELVVDAFVEEMFGGLVDPDTGDLRDDLVGISTQIWAADASAPRAQVMAGLMTAMLASAELRAAVKQASARPESVFQAAVRRAVERGDIAPPAQPELIAWVVPSMCMFRLIKTVTAPDRAFCESLIDRLVMPALRADRPGKETE
ncbi:MAG TPA: TetR/AcrR family transcriptional regulator [Acidimicrobiales bacterium]|nr:TetR/AcrR family transcriptional regulator [Acidimicrobiales bacterium]